MDLKFLESYILHVPMATKAFIKPQISILPWILNSLPMENINRKMCPVCGEVIRGRLDKKFCSDECRVYFNNAKYRNKHKSMAQSRDLATIYSTTLLLYEQNSRFLLKFLLSASKICKIFYTFGVYISKKVLRHDQSCFCIIFIVVSCIDIMC